MKIDRGLLIFGAILVMVFIALIGFIPYCSFDGGEIAPQEDAKRNPIMSTSEELQSGFFMSEEIMASFAKFNGNDGTIFMIQVERYGFSNPLYYEVSSFDEAVGFLEGLE